MSNDPGETCLACFEEILTDEECMKCAECGLRYHLGKCSGVGERTYKSKDVEARASMKCQTCRLTASRSAATARQQDGNVSIAMSKQLADISRALAALTVKVDEITSLKDAVSNIERSVQHMSDTYDKLIEASNKHDKQIEALQKTVDTLEVANNKQTIAELRTELNALNQYSRKQNMEIHGLPETEREDLMEKVNELARRLDLPVLTKDDVDGLHRIPLRSDKTPVVLIRFCKQSTKALWIAKRSTLKQCIKDVKFFDNLTAQNKRLLWLAKTKAAEAHYRFVWTKEGKIFARKEPSTRAININNESDLDKII